MSRGATKYEEEMVCSYKARLEHLTNRIERIKEIGEGFRNDLEYYSFHCDETSGMQTREEEMKVINKMLDAVIMFDEIEY